MDRRYIVIKLGGSVLPHRDAVLEDLAALQALDASVVLVHGGGASISDWLQRIGKQPVFVGGLRVTDADTLEVAVMVLAGKVNKELVALLQAAGIRAVGLSGVDGGLVRARRRCNPDLGLVGDVEAIYARLIHCVAEAGYVPVIAPIAAAASGEILNVNADTVAGELACALEADALLFLTDVAGVRDRRGKVIRFVDPALADRLRREGVIAGGMIPKVEACVRALDGARAAAIVDGSQPHAIRQLLIERCSGGTTFVRQVAAQPTPDQVPAIAPLPR